MRSTRSTRSTRFGGIDNVREADEVGEVDEDEEVDVVGVSMIHEIDQVDMAGGIGRVADVGVTDDLINVDRFNQIDKLNKSVRFDEVDGAGGIKTYSLSPRSSFTPRPAISIRSQRGRRYRRGW